MTQKIMFCKDCGLLGFPAPENNDTCGNCGSHKVDIYQLVEIKEQSDEQADEN